MTILPADQFSAVTSGIADRPQSIERDWRRDTAALRRRHVCHV